MKSNSDDSDARPCDGGVAGQSTLWTLFERVHHGNQQQIRASLGRLAEIYAPILAAMTKRFPWPMDEAMSQDCVQSFLVTRILTGKLIRTADPERGSFRKLLYVAFRNFVADQLRTEARQQELDGDGSELKLKENLDVICDEADAIWAQHILQEIIVRMRNECQLSRQMAVWNVFEARLLRPVTENSDPATYVSLMNLHGFQSVKEAANALTTAKRIFRRLSRQVLEEFSTVEIPEDELAALRRVFASGISLTEAPANTDDMTRMTQRSWLLAKALDPVPHDKSWTTEQLSAAMAELLAQPLAAFFETDLELTHSWCQTSDSLETFLCRPPRELPVLLQLKKWAKDEFSYGEAGMPPLVVSAVYFTVIAAGRVDHQQCISQLSNQEYHASTDAICRSEWIPDCCRKLLLGSANGFSQIGRPSGNEPL